MTDSRTANVLIAITARLIELMNREIQLLKSMRPSEIETLQSEKIALVQEYDEHIRQLAEEPEFVASLEPVMRDELWRVTQAFEHAVTENERALRAAGDANGRLIQAVVDASQASARDNGSYNNAGRLAPRPAHGDSRRLSLTVDRSL